MKRPRKNPADARIRKELAGLMPVFARAAVGDFSKDVDMPDADGPFDELYAGVQIMLDVIRFQLEEQIEINLALRASREKTAALLESIGEGIVALDTEGRVMFINEVAAALVGWSAQEAMGRSWYETVTAFDLDGKAPLPRAKRAHRLAFAAKRKIVQMVLYARKDGKRLPVTVTATPISLRGKPWGVIQVFRDVTSELQALQSAAEYVSLAAHQLRDPLTIIRWTAESLLLNAKLGKAERTEIDALLQADLRMITLVGAFLNVSRLDLGSFAVAPIPTDVRASVDDVLTALAPEIGMASMSIRRDYPKDLPLVNLDPKLLQVVFHNLLSNAVKYGRPGGAIRLKAALAGREIVVSVADDGPGIPKADQPRIFQKLFRSESVRARKIDGTGLGLYIVKTIVEKTGGRIWFESEEGRGTTFHVAFPLEGMRPQQGVKELNTIS